MTSAYRFHDPEIERMARVAEALGATNASSQDWAQFTGTNASTKTDTVPSMSWESGSTAIGSTSQYQADPITAGNNSYTMYQAIRFTGTWNSLSNLWYKLSTETPNDSGGASTNATVVGTVITTTSALTTAVSTALASSDAPSTGMTTSTGVPARFASSTGCTGTMTTSTTASGSSTIYGSALKTQLQTNAAAAPGDIAAVTVTAGWTES